MAPVERRRRPQQQEQQVGDEHAPLLTRLPLEVDYAAVDDSSSTPPSKTKEQANRKWIVGLGSSSSSLRCACQ
eukprot:CAMPEP_0117071262 /NCGR_PEP_ID=MMETSP0472-20121206/50078_1 /TAXON_ID=693140 ORGANISM="Tiarina fusus, Strain LIS" /NCGR_SAMPLE_ID=MMETSP0472 /ASSEMBLY_ACC=CAM_ASM_000603 /LENGTH=72 /DNA_ID=CAMNT_0004794727 /DNA_START=9 /DNA_END=224 /DNA_ORIENTATION=+